MDLSGNDLGYFVYLNSDSIPEIITPASFEMAATKLLWVDSSNNVHKEIIGARTISFEYFEKSSKMLHSSFTPNFNSVTAFELTDSGLVKTFNGGFSCSYNFPSVVEALNNGETLEMSDFNMNSTSTDEETFFSTLKSCYDYTSSSSIKNYGNYSFSLSDAKQSILNYN